MRLLVSRKLLELPCFVSCPDRCWANPPARSRHPTRACNRRDFAYTTILGFIGTKDPTTIFNSVLSGYGLPTLRQGNDLTYYDEFEDDFVFEYPRSWVVRPNSQRAGVYVSDFNTADKVTVDVFPLPDDNNIVKSALEAILEPSSQPSAASVKINKENGPEGWEYTYLEFPSYTTTSSGYSIKRKNFAVVASVPKRGEAVVLNASARSDKYDDAKRDLLRRVVASFRVR
uniref:PsbP C-terminal domain-containing protein n=1 Tax=Tetraselmis sp. GSL018 TaxID=582737 RepID=A0A061RNJ1_9CHLO|mmetsp:Transcript_26476/g.62862  ORF Transcript_26476/g.62862 Transcript_26476/m.62862 type:complete len:229 (-) Transcript_26476:77-763(-)